MQICDELGNHASLEESALEVSIELPDGSTHDTSTPLLKFGQMVKGGVTLYDVRHEATHAGQHQVHTRLTRMAMHMHSCT